MVQSQRDEHVELTQIFSQESDPGTRSHESLRSRPQLPRCCGRHHPTNRVKVALSMVAAGERGIQAELKTYVRQIRSQGRTRLSSVPTMSLGKAHVHNTLLSRSSL
jgi:hypothetical protein